MMMKHAHPTLRKPPRREQASHELDPATLGATLRELALRAHQLVRGSDGSNACLSPDDPERELAEVHAQIVELQRNLGVYQLDDLGTYVSALRARVEECLA